MKQIYYEITTNSGKFIFKITVDEDRDTHKITDYNINLGSKDNFCVQIKVPAKNTGKTDAYLMWVESKENCSLERYKKEKFSQHMTILGLTIVRNINSNIKTVSFRDTSSFMCELPDHTKIQVPMKIFHLAFHEATWYEYYFNAKLQKNHEEYSKLKKNMYKSEYKPPTFDFMNQELDEELYPLYKATTCWYDFFQAISKKYGDKKCGMVYPWISNAMYSIFQNNIYDDIHWYIDFDDNIKQNKTPIIQFDMAKINKLQGGYRKTHKKRKGRRFTFSRTHMFPNIPQIQSWKYREFIKDV